MSDQTELQILMAEWAKTRERLERERDDLRARMDEAIAALPKGVDGPGLVGAILHMVERLDDYRAERDRYRAALEAEHRIVLQVVSGHRASIGGIRNVATPQIRVSDAVFACTKGEQALREGGNDD